MDRGGYLGRSPGDSVTRILRQTNTVATATTSFTFSAGYDISFIDVYLNGSKLVVGDDYTALNGSTVDLTLPAQNGDTVEFVAYKAFNLVNNTGEVDGNFTAGGSITAGQNVTVGGDLDVSGNISGSGSNLTGIVTTITAGDNISVNQSTGGVTITGLANTANVIADSVVTDTLSVSGVGTFSGGVKGIGISSSGTVITTDAIQTLNFVGTGNTFKVTGTQVDISIEGGGGGGGGLSTTGVSTGFVFANPNAITTSIQLTAPGMNYGMFGPITISGAGVTVTVGAGNSFTIV